MLIGYMEKGVVIMSKLKILDMDTDWKIIIEQELAFIKDAGFNAGTDVRYSAIETDKKPQGTAKTDSRESILKGLIQSAAYN